MHADDQKVNEIITLLVPEFISSVAFLVLLHRGKCRANSIKYNPTNIRAATDIRDSEVYPQRECSSVFCLPQQYSRGNNTAQTNSLKDLLQNKIDDMEKQVLSRVNTLEETKGASRNDSEQRNKVESTLTSLHHRITDLEKGVCARRHFLRLI